MSRGMALALIATTGMCAGIVRAQYVLDFSISGYFGPGFNVTVRSTDPNTQLVLSPTDECLSWAELGDKAKASLVALDCQPTGPTKLSVVDKTGVEIGLEEFSYRVVENGVFCVWDAI